MWLQTIKVRGCGEGDGDRASLIVCIFQCPSPVFSGGGRGIDVAQLLLQAYPEALRVKGFHNRTPLDCALLRLEEKDEATQLFPSDPLFALLKAGGR